MKTVIKYIGLTLAVVVVADLLFGAAMGYYVRNHRIPGDYETIEHMLKGSDDELFILGSSHALNSANAALLEDSLHRPVWNGGANAQMLPYCEVMAEQLCTQPATKAIVVCLTPETFLGSNGRIKLLMPYYDTGLQSLDQYLEEGARYNRLFLKSALYRYNTIWFRILLYNFIQPGEKGAKGFVAKPIPPVMPTMRQMPDTLCHLNERDIRIVERMAQRCQEHHIRLLAFIPPMYDLYPAEERSGIAAIKEQCARLKIPVLDSYQDSLYLQHPEYFFDNAHLNKNGAEIYSRQLGHWLKEQL